MAHVGEGGMTFHDSQPEVIRAAGGLLCRQTEHGPKVAVVHRIRHGDEWTLPKGKVQPGESWEAAALREVKEETNCQAEITGYAGTIAYMAGGTPKIVVFWHMAPVGECTFRRSEEVDRLEWLSPKAAIKRITYPELRRLLGQACPTAGRNTKVRFWRRVQQRLRPLPRGRRRLAEALSSFSEELELNISKAPVSPQGMEEPWVSTTRRLVEQAQEALDDPTRTVDEGWWSFNAARRAAIEGLSAEELDDMAAVLRLEADQKLKSWRGAAIKSLLDSRFPAASRDRQRRRAVARALSCLESAVIPRCRSDDLRQRQSTLKFATFIRDEHSQNEYRKVAALRSQIQILSGFVLVVVVVLLGLAARGHLSLTNGGDADRWGTLSMVVLFGMLGGAFSGIRLLSSRSTQARIPEQQVDWIITAARPVIGAAAALAAYAFLQAGVLSLQDQAAGVVAAVSFVAGFSEQLILRTVESIGGRASQ